jgi:hypothetical protein
MAEGPIRYRYGPLERRGFIAGWRGGQAVTVGGGLLAGIGALRSLPTAAGVIVAIVAVGGGVAAATWPVAGRTPDEWLPDVARHAAIVASGRRWKAPSRPTAPSPAIPAAGRKKRGGPATIGGGGSFSELKILEVDDVDESSALRIQGRRGFVAPSVNRLAVLYDEAGGSYTAVFPASGPGFVLLSPTERERRVAGWAAALSGLARQGTPVNRVQWIARTLPGNRVIGEQMVADAVGERSPGAARASASYEELLASTTPSFSRHQVLIAVSVMGKAGAVRRLLKKPDARDRIVSCGVLFRELGAFRRRLADANVDSAPALAPRALASTIRAGFSSSDWLLSGECGTTWPWPTAGEVLWDVARMDGTWHATYWIAEWPRSEVGADFLAPLLLTGDVRQSVSVTMEPLSPLEAARRIQQDRTADVADAELRSKGGFLRTARRRREEETLVDREVELADGHAPFRFSGYLTVSADTREELDASCGRVEQSAGQSGMELRRCYGDQQRAFAFTLPLCRGLE